MPFGVSAVLKIVTTPAVVIRPTNCIPTALALAFVNQRFPSGPTVISPGDIIECVENNWVDVGGVLSYVAGSYRWRQSGKPFSGCNRSTELSTNHSLLSGPVTIPCG